MMRWIWRIAAAIVALAAAIVAIFVGNVAVGMRAHARVTGTISGLPLRAPVSILRDDRGVPHIVASNEHDLFFAQGYTEGSDRLFQMDLLRRFIEGRLAEIFGKAALASDESERAVPVRAIVDAQWQTLDAHSKQSMSAFADGVNAAIEREPMPVEFRILGYAPKPWSPQDSLAIGMAETLDLIDDWDAIAPRDAAYRKGGLALERSLFPLTDPCYDAPVTAGLRAIGPGNACPLDVSLIPELGDPRAPVGSNQWAAGALHSTTGRALLANDPHLGLRIPGIWYLVDLRAPGFHAAGTTLPGEPGVILGHNDHVAWAMTDGTVASISVYDPPKKLDSKGWRTETFAVRFGSPVNKSFYSTPHEFGVTTEDDRFVLVRWDTYERPTFALSTFYDLDRASSIEDALATLSKFRGPTHNFALADTTGRAAYALAGPIPDDPVWGRWFHPASDLRKPPYPMVAFAQLPKVAPSRDAVVWTANNKTYGPGYPLRLSPQFAAPYRAYRIAQLLRARSRYSVDYFAQMQMDALSLPERELAHEIAPSIRGMDSNAASLLAAWDGNLTGDSTAATTIVDLRRQLTDRQKLRMPWVLAHTRRSPQSLPIKAIASPEPWNVAGAVPVLHALSSLGIDLLNGTTLPGHGDEFTLHVQYAKYSQSFRAVWDVGNWDAGGITIPQGESGEPGSGHYTDQAAAWVSGRLWPLPFSEAAVNRTAVDRQTLTP
jgi:penicillin amidase